MIEVKVEGGRVWLVLNGHRVGMVPDQAMELAAVIRSAAWSVKVQAGEVVEGVPV